MNTTNFVKIFFSLLMSAMILMGSLINTYEAYLPQFFISSIRYGKFAIEGRKLKILEVPKSWFKHFYVFSALSSIGAIILAVSVYVFGKAPPVSFMLVLDATVGSLRYSTVSPACILLALVLLLLQCTRRFYDTHFVSVFSKNCYININHYLVGYIHYLGLFLAIFGEAPLFAKSRDEDNILKISDITYLDGIAALIFLWAWYHQYKVNVILANLRKNQKGKIVTQDHKLPQGDLFEYVACPHLFTEKLMYVCLTVILWGNTTWLFILGWVLGNQIETALLNYWWYKEKFPDFPKNRKAVIPFIY